MLPLDWRHDLRQQMCVHLRICHDLYELCFHLELRVRGVDGVRVIDASVMPTIPSGNTNFPAMMIAEQGADLILKR